MKSKINEYAQSLIYESEKTIFQKIIPDELVNLSW